ncbi:hypothetical protein [Streptomyces sp. NPDC096324]|uniref:hypothetical protein n=1 Tax=Streptomyces sp. NPDC096324 TaxID=3366085 RepID=UPI003819C962
MTEDGRRQVLGLTAGDSQTEVFWDKFLRSLHEPERVNREIKCRVDVVQIFPTPTPSNASHSRPHRDARRRDLLPLSPPP